jgi:hypothetical protein
LELNKEFSCKVIILGFAEPTKKHKRDLLETSVYWEAIKIGILLTDTDMNYQAKKNNQKIYKIKLGSKILNALGIGICSIHDEETKRIFSSQYISRTGKYIFCKTQEEFDMAEKLDYQDLQWIGKVIEVLTSNINPDTGKLHHPYFYRLREDIDPLTCTWKNHITLD